MNLPKFPHSAMFVGATNVRKTEYLLGKGTIVAVLELKVGNTY